MKCFICGFESPEGSAFCANCGARLEQGAPVKEKKGMSPLFIVLIALSGVILTAALVAFWFFGGFDLLFGPDPLDADDVLDGVVDDHKNDNYAEDFYLLFGGGSPDKENGENSGDDFPPAVETAPSETAAVTTEADSETAAVTTEAVFDTEAVTTAPPETAEPEPSWEGSGRVVIANGGLNMRSSPSLSAGIINCIPNGNLITVEKVENNWAYVFYGSSYGWCSCDYLFVPVEYDLSPICTATVVCDEKIEIHCEDYGSDGDISTEVFNGTTVYVYKLEGELALIKYNNIYGWCSGFYLDMTSR